MAARHIRGGFMRKQIVFASIASLSLSAAAAAQEQAQPGAPPSPTGQALAARTCELPKIADTAPLQPVEGSSLMTVPVVINGVAKQFLLDIGLKRPTQVSPELMAELSLPEDVKRTELIQFGPGGASFAAPYQGIQVPVYDVRNGGGGDGVNTRVRVSSFAIGNATDHHLQMTVTKKGEIGRSAPYDGFLSGDLLRKYDVELDFAGRQMTWLTPTSCTDPNQVVFWAHRDVAILPVSLAKDGRLQMQAMVGGHPINAEIDTSSAHTVMRRDIAELYVGLKADKDMIPDGDLKDGMHMQIYLHLFPELIFAGGSVTAVNVPVRIQTYSMRTANDRDLNSHMRGVIGESLAEADRIPDLSIGMDVLRHLHMYVVPGQAKVYVTAAEAAQ
jgi:hypothetical protein